MVKPSPTLGALVSIKTKCIKVICIGKITLVPVAFLMALSISWELKIVSANFDSGTSRPLTKSTPIEILCHLLQEAGLFHCTCA